jgi:hypothetical protein
MYTIAEPFRVELLLTYVYVPYGLASFNFKFYPQNVFMYFI